MGFESAIANEALVISGCCHATPLTVVGPRRKWVWPCQKCQRICLKTFTLNIYSKEVMTSERIPISCVGIAQVKILESNHEMLKNACTIFLDKPENEIEKAATETIEAHQNSVISTMVLEEIYFNRKKFCTKVFENAASELVFMGLAVVSYTLKTVTENQGHLVAIGQKRREELGERSATTPGEYTVPLRK